MPATNRGAAWEWGNSWWILLTFCFGLLSGPAFLYAGRKARTGKWVIAGFVYLLTWVALGLTPAEPKALPPGAPRPAVEEPASPIPYGSTASDVLVASFLALWLASMVHAVWVRNEYLRRLDAVHGDDPYAHLRREVAEEMEFEGVPTAPWALFEGGPPPPPPAPALPPRPVEPVRAEPAGAAVDLNNAPEDELSALPGIGPVLARRAAEERRMRGGFGSLEEFGEVLALKPHILERLRSRVVLGPPPPPAVPPPAPGAGRRVVDF